MKFKRTIKNLFLSLLSLTLTIIIVELSYLYIIKDEKNEFYCHYPFLQNLFLPSNEIFPGINDSSFFSTNSLGFRGQEINENADYRILTIGGSTTECLFLDDNETWPNLLEEKLNHQIGENTYQLLNAGKSGITSNHHLEQLKILLNKYKWITEVIILQGINDLQYSLALYDQYFQKDKLTYLREAFSISPDSLNSFYKKLLLYKLYQKVKQKYFIRKLQQDISGENYTEWRDNRRNAKQIIDKLPRLQDPLNDYARNIIEQINVAKSLNKKIIFLTQPVIWKKDIPKDLEKLCWFGWIGMGQSKNTGKYYSISVLELLMNKYNKVLKEVCDNNNVDYIDLANKLNQDTSVFYDDCHFNESGANRVAEIIFENILKNSTHE